MQDFCHYLKKDHDIGAIQNTRSPIDLDYNLEIVRCEDYEDCRYIKECARKSFNKALKKHGWEDCDDSTSSLITKKRYFVKGNPTRFSMDVCIVCRDTDEYFYRLINNKKQDLADSI